jgi:hypothetical protein
MPAWSNTDAPNAKPKWDVERQTREVAQFGVFAGNTAGNNVISVAYNDGGLNNVANVGVAVGQYVYFMANGFGAPGGTAGNGYPGFFESNTQVTAISGNTVTLGTALFGSVTTSFGVEFDRAIAYNTNKPYDVTYNQDTILVTATRMGTGDFTGGGGNNVVNVQPSHAGWVHIQKKTNNDGTVRYLSETLVVTANATASNTNSGNTSWGQAYSGV